MGNRPHQHCTCMLHHSKWGNYLNQTDQFGLSCEVSTLKLPYINKNASGDHSSRDKYSQTGSSLKISAMNTQMNSALLSSTKMASETTQKANHTKRKH